MPKHVKIFFIARSKKTFLRTLNFTQGPECCYLFFTKREKDFLQIQEACQLIAGAFPLNAARAKEQPSFLLTHTVIMPDLPKVVRYFFDNTPRYHLYLRQLTIEKLHTKFIEDNYKPLRQLI